MDLKKENTIIYSLHENQIKKCFFYWSWNCGPFEVERNSRLSSPFWVRSIRGWVPFGVKSILWWVPFWVQSILSWVHSGLSPFGVESIRGWVHSGLSTLGVESLRDWVDSGMGPFRVQSHSGLSPLGQKFYSRLSCSRFSWRIQPALLDRQGPLLY
jgi:hypothetical protein